MTSARSLPKANDSETPFSLGNDIADLSRESIIATALDGTICFWNAAAERLYGYSATEALGKPIDTLLSSRHPFGIDAVETELLGAGQWNGEIYRVSASGRDLCATIRKVVRKSTAGHADAILEWSQDATDVSDAEIAAHRYSNIFHAMATSFWELDFSEVRKAVGGLVAAGEKDVIQYLRTNHTFIDHAISLVRVVDVNDMTLALYGASSRQDILSRDICWTWPPESRHVFAESLVAAFERRDHYSTETVLKTLDGRRINVLFTVCWPQGHKARGTVLVGVVDITERKRSEARFKDLFQHVPVALLQLRMQPLYSRIAELSRIHGQNTACYLQNTPAFVHEMLGLVEIEKANDKAIALLGAENEPALRGPIVWAWKDRPETLMRSLHARLRGEAAYSEETVVNTIDGRQIDVIYTISFSEELMEQGINVVGLIDISERKRADSALRDTEARLIRAQSDFSHAARITTLGELAASIAHEVNQPLTAIAAFGQASLRWLKRPEPDVVEIRSLNEQIVSDAIRASEIVARIRRMALKRAPDPQLTKFTDVLDESLLILRHEASIHAIDIHTDIDTTLPPVVVDRVQLQQVIVNLAVNAIQAMTDNGDEQRELTVRLSGSDDTVSFSIADTGHGIDPKHIDLLFSDFFSTKDQGMGIGLSICRSIIEAHGGSIRAENHGRGARFTFDLPVAGATQSL